MTTFFKRAEKKNRAGLTPVINYWYYTWDIREKEVKKIDFFKERRYPRNSRRIGRRNFLINFLKAWGKNLHMSKFSEDAWSPIENKFVLYGTYK